MQLRHEREAKSDARCAESTESRRSPSAALMRAVASGLLGLGMACDDKTPEQEADPERHEHEANLCTPAATAGSGGAAGESSTGHDKDAGVDSGKVALSGSTSEADKEISVKDVQLTNAELVKMCDERQGYVQIHGSCSGVNTCRGFFYGDWEADAQLIEHTCSGVNGCSGLSCLTTAEEPEGGGLTGEEIMKLDDAWFEERAGQYGAKSCKTCHVASEFNEEKQDYEYDFSKLKIPVWASAGRDGSNWLKRSAAYQESLIAFGAQGITEEGIRYSNMAPYAKLFSKAEIQRVVQYMRGFDAKDITFKEIKLHPGKVE